MLSDGGMRQQLREQVQAAHDDTPADERYHSRWVMSEDWLDDLRSLDDGTNFWWEPPGGPILMYGLPLEFRERGGAPHLEQWPYRDLIRFVIDNWPDQTRRALFGTDKPIRIPVSSD